MEVDDDYVTTRKSRGGVAEPKTGQSEEEKMKVRRGGGPIPDPAQVK